MQWWFLLPFLLLVYLLKVQTMCFFPSKELFLFSFRSCLFAKLKLLIYSATCLLTSFSRCYYCLLMIQQVACLDVYWPKSCFFPPVPMPHYTRLKVQQFWPQTQFFESPKWRWIDYRPYYCSRSIWFDFGGRQQEDLGGRPRHWREDPSTSWNVAFIPMVLPRGWLGLDNSSMCYVESNVGSWDPVWILISTGSGH